jgi:separase
MVSRYHEKSRLSHIETTKVKPDEHLILILDKHLHMFPLESMPLLRSQAVSRLPCISLLRDRIHYAKAYNNRRAFDDFGLVNAEEWKDLYVSEKSAYYVVNPSGDLKGTQQEFETPFKRAPGWDGIVDGKPTELQLKSSLLSKDIYIYLGHGAGQTFMRGQVVKQLPRCAVSLLMGCSSGALKSNGDFDPHGYVLNYLLGGR